MTIDFRTKDAVRQSAIELRTKHSALDWTANVDHLIEREGLSQGRYTLQRGEWSFDQFVRATKKAVKALISIKEAVILLSNDIHSAREGFAKAHELGHSTLPWHREILYVCDEHDLNMKTRLQMEWEANMFAQEVLLPTPLLKVVYQQHPISMQTVLHLAQLSGASIESCAVAYALEHPGCCVLLTMEFETSPVGERQLRIIKKVVSNAASKSALGSLNKGQVFPSQHVLSIAAMKSEVSTCDLTLTNSGAACKASVLHNGYRALALAYF